ncbi:MAG TPA: MATE family efflux transporter [Gemmatimonadales bacterium]|nr:MATE family efflux transporter [Gemmatimonadales bacterium]
MSAPLRPAAAPGPATAARLQLDTSSRTIWAIASPVVLAGLSEHIVEITDTALLARFGTIELAAIGMAAAIYEVVVFFTFGLADSIQIVAARRAGQGREQAIGDAFFHGASLLAALSLALFLILAFASPVVTRAILRTDSVRWAVDDFLRIIAFAVLFHCLNMAYGALYVGIGRTRPLIAATVVLAVTNVGLDYLLIFGHLGLPRLGIKGAAAGSLIAEIAAFGVLTWSALRRGDARRFGLFRPRRLDPSLAKAMLTIGWPAALQRLVEAVRWFLFFLIIEHIGASALAIANIVHGVYALFLLPLDALAETVCTMASNLIGQERSSRIGGLLRSTMAWATLAIVPFVVLALAWPEIPLSLFTTDPELLSGAAGSLRVASLALLIVIPGALVLGAVEGTGDTRTALVIELVLSVGVLLSAYAAAIVLHLPLAGIWASEIVGWLVCLLMAYGWLRSGRWRRVSI